MCHIWVVRVGWVVLNGGIGLLLGNGRAGVVGILGWFTNLYQPMADLSDFGGFTRLWLIALDSEGNFCNQ